MKTDDKLKKLRDCLKREKLDGFIIPRADEFQNEYVPPKAERLSWLTGFTGSAGVALVTKDKAAVLSDGRYTIQLKQQVDAACFETGDSTKESIGEVLLRLAPPKAIIGYDPWLHTPRQIKAIEEKLNETKITLKPVTNIVDQARGDIADDAIISIEQFSDAIAGKTSIQKRSEIAEIIKQKNCKAAVITLPDSLSWLLNVRGKDVAHNPVVLSYGILHADTAALDWFVDERKVPSTIKAQLGNTVRIFPLKDIEKAVVALGKDKDSRPVMLDMQRSAIWFFNTLKNSGASIRDERDPIIMPKACKTKTEQDSMRAVHARDGLAVTKFLHWLAHDTGPHDEISVADKLEDFRKQDSHYRDTSFDTIAGWNGNGAIVHYRAMPATASKITPPGILLLDSGGQYADGTTDITRTIALGPVTHKDVADHFTRVLKGHIALARAIFPQGTTGAQLDSLARQPLWEQGLDYAHGTGHGVGCYLSVHEEAASISPRGQEPVLPGMIISNEPGYYREGEYGIRIENLILCRATDKEAPDGRKMLDFETITLAPLDRRLIKKDILNADEIAWVNSYHQRVYDTHAPHLDDAVKAWLKSETSAI